ncbi:aminoacetone oxidase family FAD-binding enzyme [Halalkalibacillus sediminis]|uniref:Aminoacetone oxidase family FAD-binding enzyme n=1 Tax=Halalkalibacillus sediminis TaxID=2018042 RepID=A0A2I0QYF0_9BACI|nr:NAD(P)/FAD-dependent oxidoreductase [Halalkalibacillus sediminis]PKR79339.1 aminoacetone oxidase family FAD-binding enzyme [Halalkalibacillus sediminis]
MKYDVIIIGGGPSGLMAAISAGRSGAKTLLIEKGSKLGRKLAISGGGRCNVTNVLPDDELIAHIPGNGRFLYSAFSLYNNYSIIDYFESLGVKLKEEDKGRMFPVSDSAKTVVQTLIKELDVYSIDSRLNTKVEAVDYGEQQHQVILEGGEKVECTSLVIAVGGKSVPHTGSEGQGYAWAKKAGHTITELYPTEVPMTSKEKFIRDKVLQGISIRDVELTALKPNGKPIKTHRWDLIFTHQGISGPAALRISQYVVKALKKFDVDELTCSIDTFPDESPESLSQKLIKASERQPNKAVKHLWKEEIPERYLLFLMDRTSFDPMSTFHHLEKKKVMELAGLMKDFRFKVNGTLPIEKAFITGGGVSLKEIIPNQMASKLMDRLYFCGEILDIHGYTGGFNITAAFSTGHVAGMNAAERAIIQY